ncbi:MAG TPA: XdhC family protein [Kofleriaceae bacterium]
MGGLLKRELFDLAGSLIRAGESFVIATVVRRDGLSSAHQGDMAIVQADGTFHGWLGGGCTRPTVEREAAVTLAQRQPRLVLLTPQPQRDARPGVIVFPMTCHSGGTVEIYLDPVLASPRLALFGRSPIVNALARLAEAIGYLVDIVDPDGTAGARVFTSLAAPELAGADFVVIGSMGDFDEDAVMRALELAPKYIGVIASRRRFTLLCDELRARGIDAGPLSAIVNPAGLDLGAREAGEVAVSILAQIVERRNAERVEAEVAIEAPRAVPATAIDPVCKMTVTVATAKHVAAWDGRDWYFCCGGCKARFLAEPAKFQADVQVAG